MMKPPCCCCNTTHSLSPMAYTYAYKLDFGASGWIDFDLVFPSNYKFFDLGSRRRREILIGDCLYKKYRVDIFAILFFPFCEKKTNQNKRAIACQTPMFKSRLYGRPFAQTRKSLLARRLCIVHVRSVLKWKYSNLMHLSTIDRLIHIPLCAQGLRRRRKSSSADASASSILFCLFTSSLYMLFLDVECFSLQYNPLQQYVGFHPFPYIINPNAKTFHNVAGAFENPTASAVAAAGMP